MRSCRNGFVFFELTILILNYIIVVQRSCKPHATSASRVNQGCLDGDGAQISGCRSLALTRLHLPVAMHFTEIPGNWGIN